MDVTAGGGPSYGSFRDNYQWLLGCTRDTNLTFELSLPDPRLSSKNLCLAAPPKARPARAAGGRVAARI